MELVIRFRKDFQIYDGGDSWTDWTANLNPYAKSIVVQPMNRVMILSIYLPQISTIKMLNATLEDMEKVNGLFMAMDFL